MMLSGIRGESSGKRQQCFGSGLGVGATKVSGLIRGQGGHLEGSI